jgi:hypothetical protein
VFDWGEVLAQAFTKIVAAASEVATTSDALAFDLNVTRPT